jgi:hypothetical protein
MQRIFGDRGEVIAVAGNAGAALPRLVLAKAMGQHVTTTDRFDPTALDRVKSRGGLADADLAEEAWAEHKTSRGSAPAQQGTHCRALRPLRPLALPRGRSPHPVPDGSRHLGGVGGAGRPPLRDLRALRAAWTHRDPAGTRRGRQRPASRSWRSMPCGWMASGRSPRGSPPWLTTSRGGSGTALGIISNSSWGRPGQL